MNDEIIQDLKQFITATTHQQTFEIVERIDKVENRLDVVEVQLGKLEVKVDDLSLFVGEALEASNQAIDLQLKDHNKRLIRLERKAA